MSLTKLYRRLRQHRAIARLAGTRVLGALAAANPQAFFIQVGANDGRMMDPLRKNILATQWRGLALEPVPDLYRALCNNYAQLSGRVQPVNAALAQSSGEQTFYHLADQHQSDPLPSWASGLGSFRKNVILEHASRIPGIENYLLEIQVPCLSWADLCAQYDVDTLDLVLTDTEGYDFEIVRQIDFQRHRPLVLIYEHHHFDAQTDAACTTLLKQKGYHLFREGLDSWAIDATNTDPRYATLRNRWPRWVRSSGYAEPL